jgi:hypothetical protein
MMKKALVILSMIFFTSETHAQTGWIQLTWPAYGIDFELPENFVIIESSPETYMAESKGFSFSMRPWRDSTLTAEQVAAKALAELNADNVSITFRDKIDLDGFEGYEMIGAGEQEGNGLFFVALGFIDPLSDLNYSAYILFWHDPEKDDDNIRIAKRIVEGIRKSE